MFLFVFRMDFQCFGFDVDKIFRYLIVLFFFFIFGLVSIFIKQELEIVINIVFFFFCILTIDKLILKYLLIRIFYIGVFWWFYLMRYFKTLVWNFMVARLIISFFFSFSREMFVSSLIKYFTVESFLEFVVSNRGVDRILKYKEFNGFKLLREVFFF